MKYYSLEISAATNNTPVFQRINREAACNCITAAKVAAIEAVIGDSADTLEITDGFSTIVFAHDDYEGHSDRRGQAQWEADQCADCGSDNFEGYCSYCGTKARVV